MTTKGLTFAALVWVGQPYYYNACHLPSSVSRPVSSSDGKRIRISSQMFRLTLHVAGADVKEKRRQLYKVALDFHKEEKTIRQKSSTPSVGTLVDPHRAYQAKASLSRQLSAKKAEYDAATKNIKFPKSLTTPSAEGVIKQAQKAAGRARNVSKT